MAHAAIGGGSAFGKFRVLVEAQGGDVSFVDHPEKLPRASLIEEVPSPQSGWLAQVDARAIGEAAVELGAGRASKADAVDHAVGTIIYHKVGDRIEAGVPLFAIHANDPKKGVDARDRVMRAHVIVEQPVSRLPLFYQ